MAKASETRPALAEKFLRDLKPPTDSERKRRSAVIARARKNREQMDIRPMTTTELVRRVREES